MTTDSKRLVATAYDVIADTYLERFGVSSVRQKWLRRLVEALPPRAGRVLDLGCGAGVPVAMELASAGHSVVGVDGSGQQIVRARRSVPDAKFIQADMSEVRFDAGSFDAVGAFYSVTHLPADEHGPLFMRIAEWLKPGGTFVASLGTGMSGDWTGDWLGTTMFFGHNSEATSLALLREAGLAVQQTEVERQDNEDAVFLWVVAVRAPIGPLRSASRSKQTSR